MATIIDALKNIAAHPNNQLGAVSRGGTRIKGGLTTEIKRFIFEMYEEATDKKLLP